MALPVLTALVPAERSYVESPRAHKALLDAARVVPVDNTLATIAFLAVIAHDACMVARLRLDANLFVPAPPVREGAWGRRPPKGPRLPKLVTVPTHRATVWQSHMLVLWYRKRGRATDISVEYRVGLPPVSIRW